MSGRRIICRILGLTAVSLTAVLGCETLHQAGVPGLEQYAKVDHEGLALEKSNREKFSVHRDHQALYWLLSNRVSNGMTLRDVEEILGESGEYTTDFKANDSEGLHQTTDSAYKWGPDSQGKSVVLFFRDGHVCNFRRKYYKES